MPIRIQSDLPAREVLESENIFVMDEKRAIHQDIRPLQVCILNLMPLKEDTELQLLRAFSNTPLQIDLTFLMVKSHIAQNTSVNHLNRFYTTFDEIKDRKFDGMIITGAPVEQMPFEEVDYWRELCEIMKWSRSHVYSTFHICWGAQAGLYYHYGIEKLPLEKKLFGIFPHMVTHKGSILFRGFDDVFLAPHSRHTTVSREQIAAHPKLKILAESPEAGVYAISTDAGRQIFITGHAEYDADTLAKEYFRDKEAGHPIDLPKNYYPDDDDTKTPLSTWRSGANLLFSNWLNYFVYQATPYEVDTIPPI